MEREGERGVHGRAFRLTAWIGVPLLGAAVLSLAAYFAASAYFFQRAEENIRDVLLAHRGFHQYIQRTMHPQFYRDREEGRIPEDYYSPVLLSSSYVVREVHGFFNEERAKAGLPPVYYKMAADNPRNPVNLATPLESGLIRMFNERRGLRQYRDTVTVDGERYLLYAIPFLENTPACLRCHGRREDAPAGLRALYPGEGGFNEKAGIIRAVEVIRAPLAREIQTAAIASAALTGGLLAFGVLFLFNSRLRHLVHARTADLEKEVHERRRAESEVRDLNRDLERRVEERTAELRAINEELDAFSYSVSHDLRAPLRAVEGFSQILELECSGALDDAGRGHLARVRKGCQRMGHLIEDLLRLSRVTRRELVRETVDLSALAHEVAGELRAGAPGRDVAFRIQPGLSASGDPTLLRAVLDNLLGNAFKFTSGAPGAVVELGRTEGRDGEVFFVRDNGVGFDARLADRLFVPFRRLHATSEFEGSGIGLATVRRIVLRHGGEVWAESELGRGATFFFTLGARPSC